MACALIFGKWPYLWDHLLSSTCTFWQIQNLDSLQMVKKGGFGPLSHDMYSGVNSWVREGSCPWQREVMKSQYRCAPII